VKRELRIHGALVESQRRVLERIASGVPLAEILEMLVRLVEDQAQGMRCAVLLADPEQKRLTFAASPSIPEDYRTGMGPFLRIAPNMGSCGTAAFLREPVYTRDTASDALWRDCGHIAVRNGLRAIWSTPILSDDGPVLGTFAMYYEEPRLPLAEHMQLIDMATQIARVAIQRERDEQRLRASEEKFRQIAETIREVFWMTTPAMDELLYVSPAYENVWGRSVENVRHRPRSFMDAIHDHDRDQVISIIEARREQGFKVEYRIVRPDGSIRWISDRGFPVKDEFGKVYRIAGIAEDITERKHAEEVLRQSAAELRAMSQQLVELQESERRNLSRELHDRVGQNLTALRINLAILGPALQSHGNEDVRARMNDSAALLESTIETIDDVTSELRPQMLDDFGIAPALERYAGAFSARTGIAVAVRGTNLPKRPPPQVEIALFRIAQEALNNVAKHAHARRVEIALDHANGECTMSVRDDGIGLDGIADTADKPNPRLGIVTMRERSQAIGGRFEVRTLPGGGTRLTVRVPC
jgi:PAS domain S-box-containing protein